MSPNYAIVSGVPVITPPQTSMAQNLYEVQSVKHFQDLLSEDLKRVSLIYFWTSWAEPCKQMSEVVEELSKKYRVILFLKAGHSRVIITLR